MLPLRSAKGNSQTQPIRVKTAGGDENPAGAVHSQTAAVEAASSSWFQVHLSQTAVTFLKCQCQTLVGVRTCARVSGGTQKGGSAVLLRRSPTQALDSLTPFGRAHSVDESLTYRR